MTTKTLKWVSDKPRTFNTQHGDKAAISVIFEPDEKAELTTNPDKVADRLTTLKALIGKPGEWEVQDQGEWPDGNKKPLRIKSWPGKPQQGFTGNGQRSGKSPEERASIEKQVALKAAVEFAASGSDAARVVAIATDFYAWLSGASPSPTPGKAVSEEGAVDGTSVSSPPAPEPSEVAASTALGKGREAAASDTASGGGDAGTSSPETFNEDAPANAEQIARLKELYGGPVSATRTVKEKAGVQSLNDLTQGQAAALIEAKFKG